eukprot:evm.model.scf_7.10 EVM.evm.TU.scf_7.10   scf_7:67786-74455(-)
MAGVGILSMVDNLQHFNLAAQLPVNLSESYSNLAGALKWVNFEVDLGMGMDTLSPSHTPSGRRRLQDWQSYVNDAQQLTDFVWVKAGGRLIALSVLFVAMLAIHFLILLAWGRVKKLKSKPLPKMLVFPRLELLFCQLTFLGAAEASGMLMASSDGAAVAVGLLALAYLCVFTGVVCVVLFMVAWNSGDFGVGYQSAQNEEHQNGGMISSWLGSRIQGQWGDPMNDDILKQKEPERTHHYLETGLNILPLIRLMGRIRKLQRLKRSSIGPESYVGQKVSLVHEQDGVKTAVNQHREKKDASSANAVTAIGEAGRTAAQRRGKRMSRAGPQEPLKDAACVSKPPTSGIGAFNPGGGGQQGKKGLPRSWTLEQEVELSDLGLEIKERVGLVFEENRGSSKIAASFFAVTLGHKFFMAIVIGVAAGSGVKPSTMASVAVAWVAVLGQLTYAAVTTQARPNIDRFKWTSSVLSMWLQAAAYLCAAVYEAASNSTLLDAVFYLQLMAVMVQLLFVYLLTLLKVFAVVRIRKEIAVVVEKYEEEKRIEEAENNPATGGTPPATQLPPPRPPKRGRWVFTRPFLHFATWRKMGTVKAQGDRQPTEPLRPAEDAQPAYAWPSLEEVEPAVQKEAGQKLDRGRQAKPWKAKAGWRT